MTGGASARPNQARQPVLARVTWRACDVRTTCHGAKSLRLENAADTALQQPDDMIIRVTAAAICGSDPHFHRGEIPGMEDGN
jgi:D-arabinose 1-dehydrogenase-like Zn-dependent alcohol dehydrogenase